MHRSATSCNSVKIQVLNLIKRTPLLQRNGDPIPSKPSANTGLDCYYHANIAYMFYKFHLSEITLSQPLMNGN